MKYKSLKQSLTEANFDPHLDLTSINDTINCKIDYCQVLWIHLNSKSVH